MIQHKIIIEIDESDIRELFNERLQSYDIKLNYDQFDKLYNKHKNELIDIYISDYKYQIENNTENIGSDDFESFIEDNNLDSLTED